MNLLLQRSLSALQDKGELGCFSLTEKLAGVSSGLVVNTVADWDAAKQSFSLHSPDKVGVLCVHACACAYQCTCTCAFRSELLLSIDFLLALSFEMQKEKIDLSLLKALSFEMRDSSGCPCLPS